MGAIAPCYRKGSGMTGRQASNENPKDAATSKGLMPNGLTADGTPIHYHAISGLAKHDCPRDVPNSQRVIAASIGTLLWAQPRGRDLACIADSIVSGRRYIDFRTFYPTDDGWRPKRNGCTIPIESFQGVLDALNTLAAGDRPKPANDSENGLESA